MARQARDKSALYNSPFARNMRDLLRIHKETQEYVGNSIGKSRPTVQQYCDGSSEAPYETLVKIAQHFNVTVDWLLGMPNAPMYEEFGMREIKGASGLSDIAADNLITAMMEEWNMPIDHLLKLECFPSVMRSLHDCETLAFLLHNDSDRIIVKPESPNAIALKHCGFEEMSLNLEDFLNVLITDCFNRLKEGYLAKAMELTKVPVTVGTITEEELAHMKEEQRNGNDHGTEE